MTTSPDPREADQAPPRELTPEILRIQGSLIAVDSELQALADIDDHELLRRLADMERRWRTELLRILPEDLHDELHHLLDWIGRDDADAGELRIGVVALCGWVNGLLASLALLAGVAAGEEPRPGPS